MKVCSRCGESRPLDEFARNASKKDGRQAWCRPCKNGHHQGYYAENKEEWLVKASAYRKSVRAKLDDLKREPCRDCGLTFDPICMDFDHLDDKLRNISNMVGHNSWENILEEITKCELVCACCHRLRTKARSSSGQDVTLSR